MRKTAIIERSSCERVFQRLDFSINTTTGIMDIALSRFWFFSYRGHDHGTFRVFYTCNLLNPGTGFDETTFVYVCTLRRIEVGKGRIKCMDFPVKEIVQISVRFERCLVKALPVRLRQTVTVRLISIGPHNRCAGSRLGCCARFRPLCWNLTDEFLGYTIDLHAVSSGPTPRTFRGR